MKLLDNLLDLPDNSKVALYGLGKFSEYTNFILSTKRPDIDVLFFIDPNQDGKKEKFNNKPILPLDTEDSLMDDVDYILYCDDYNSLNKLEETEMPDYFLVVNPNILYNYIYNDISIIFKRQELNFNDLLFKKEKLIKVSSDFPNPMVLYNSDSLIVADKNLGFQNDKKFLDAYKKGIALDNIITDISYRVYISCWAAQKAKRLEGDFVECGVNKGVISKTIVEYIDFYNIQNKKFYLFDTYEGLVPEQQLEQIEKDKYSFWKNYYTPCYEETKKAFQQYPNVSLVKGIVPESLHTVQIDKVAYLSIDMNCAYPEIEAIKFFWDKLVSGAVVILDDYAWRTHEPQKNAFDSFCLSKNVEILTLPTGQGMIIKP